MRKRRVERALTPALVAALSLCACGPADPRFGSVSVSAAAPRASLTGHTSATGVPAIDLSPGCPGFVDASVPEHLVRLDDASAITISARSLRGPLTIAVVGPGEVRCDSDEGTGHAPHVTVTQPGEYLVHVGALTAPADLAYELTLAPASTDATGTPSGGDHRVSVTVTSDPSGATVRTPQGETLGTTPAMFVLTVPESEIGTDRRFVLEMPGHPSTEIAGHVIGDTMVIHATLTESPTVAAPSAPALAPAVLASGTLDAPSTGAAAPIRDYRTATQSLAVPTACTIGSMSVEVDAQHAYSQDLRITLHGPGGQSATLANHTGGSRPYSPHTYAWDDARGALHAFAGTSTQGTWSLDVRDDAGEDEGTLRSFTLHFTCGVAPAAPPVPPVVTSSAPPRPPRPSRSPPRPVPGQVLDPWASRPQPPPPTPPPPSTGVFRNGGAGAVLMPTY